MGCAYNGGKQKIGEEITLAMLSFLVENNLIDSVMGYCEPFVGMGGVLAPMNQMITSAELKWKLYANDINEALMSMWIKLQKGWIPPIKCTKTKYLSLKKSRDITAERGYLGHACSYRGRYFGTYFTRNNLALYSDKLSRMAKEFKRVKFMSGTYDQFSDLKGFVIYCDPPYEKTDQRYYDGNDRTKFDNEQFWKWAQTMATNNIVFVSEYTDPPVDFNLIWKDNNGREKLYIIG